MKRIKLPGSLKRKKILLAILVVISVVVIAKYGIDNKRDKEAKEKVVEEKRLEDERIKKEEEEVTKGLEEQEDKLYNEAYSSFFSESNYNKTIEKANILLKEFSSSYKGYNIRGIAKAYSGNFEDGMRDIDKALEIKPDYGYARFNKALNYELYRKFEESLMWYDKALEVEDYVWSYYGKASIYGRRGDVENTVINLRKAIEVADKTGGGQGVKEEAKKEHDFDNVRKLKEFQDLINK